MDTVSFENIGNDTPFAVNAKSADTFTMGTHEGYPVKVTGNKEMGHCDDGDVFHAFVDAISRDGNLLTVKKRGFHTVGYSGSAPTAGLVLLLAAGSGAVKEDAGGVEYFVVDVDTTNTELTVWLG